MARVVSQTPAVGDKTESQHDYASASQAVFPKKPTTQEPEQSSSSHSNKEEQRFAAAVQSVTIQTTTDRPSPVEEPECQPKQSELKQRREVEAKQSGEAAAPVKIKASMMGFIDMESSHQSSNTVNKLLSEEKEKPQILKRKRHPPVQSIVQTRARQSGKNKETPHKKTHKKRQVKARQKQPHVRKLGFQPEE